MTNLEMVKISLFVVASIASSAPVSAEDDYTPGGYYQSHSGQEIVVDLTPLSDNRYAINITTTVQITDELPGCGGGVSGEILIVDDAATLSIPNEGFIPTESVSRTNLEYCRIDLNFRDEYTIKLNELSGCSYYHGAGCDFSGDVFHDAWGI